MDVNDKSSCFLVFAVITEVPLPRLKSQRVVVPLHSSASKLGLYCLTTIL